MQTLTPRPVLSSLDELLRGATCREPFLTSDSKSGSGFERLVLDGAPHVLKLVHPDRDWTMRFSGDVGCHPVQVWAAGLMDALPDRIDHATVAVAGGLGRNGWGGAILMRDVGTELVPSGDEPLGLQAHRTVLDDMAALSARMLGWRDLIGLVPLVARWGWFGPACLAAEAARGWPDLVPRVAAQGWERFAARAPRAARDVVDALRRDPGPRLVPGAQQRAAAGVEGGRDRGLPDGAGVARGRHRRVVRAADRALPARRRGDLRLGEGARRGRGAGLVVRPRRGRSRVAVTPAVATAT